MTQTDTRSPKEIEAEIRRTQRDMSRTADRIGDQFTPRNMFDALLDKAEQNGVDAQYMLDQARRNPIALGMIAIGGLWLVSDSDARVKTFTDKFDDEPAPGDEWDHAHHSDYVKHMSSVEPRDGEDHETFRRRRDCARATFLLIEQRHDEDEKSFRKRLDEATDKLREQRDNMAQRARDLGSRAKSQAGRLSDRAEQAYRENPLVGGLLAAIAGAMAGAAFPSTRLEEEALGDYGAEAIDTAHDEMRDKKDEAVEQANRKLERSNRQSFDDRIKNPAHETA